MSTHKKKPTHIKAKPVHTSPDVLLSSLHIRYDGSAVAPPGSPTDIVHNLQALSDALAAPVHESKDFNPAPKDTPTAFSPKATMTMNAAVAKYYDVLRTGDVKKTHDACDAVNALRAKAGGVEFECAADFDIIAHQKGLLGDTARWLTQNHLEAESNPDVLCAFWTDEGRAAIDAYTFSG